MAIPQLVFLENFLVIPHPFVLTTGVIKANYVPFFLANQMNQHGLFRPNHLNFIYFVFQGHQNGCPGYRFDFLTMKKGAAPKRSGFCSFVHSLFHLLNFFFETGRGLFLPRLSTFRNSRQIF
jgi:hypothetical protein